MSVDTMFYTPTASSSSMAPLPQRTRTRSSSFNGGSASSGIGRRRSSINGDNGPCMVQNAVALAVIARLHRWCCQLFWLTIVCLAHYCGTNNGAGNDSCGESSVGGGKSTEEKRTATFQEVRRSIINATSCANKGSQRRLKTVTELEMQLLRHLTCPQTAVLRTLRPSSNRRRHYLSRPPSPQLFDIYETEEAE